MFLYYLLNFLGLACFIASFLVKGKKMGLIIFLCFCGNALVGLAYLKDGRGMTAAASSFLGAAQALINYFFQSRSKKIPWWIIIMHVASFVGLNLWVGKLSWGTMLAIVGCLCGVMALIQNSGKRYRFWMLCNNTTWGAYDILLHTYGGLIIHIVLMLFTLTGVFIHDIKRSKRVN